MSTEYSEWDLKVSQWRGETLRALEDMNSELAEIKQDIKDIKEQNIRRDWRTAEIAGGMAIIIMVFGFIIQNGFFA